jgi:hypothetical protein
MSTERCARRGLTLAATAVLLTTTACATAPMVSNGARVDTAAVGAKAPGWRVVKTIGRANTNLIGMLAADSAKDAWSVWVEGGNHALVEHWTGRAWTSVPLPATVESYVVHTIAFGASSARDFWAFGASPSTKVLRWTGARWVFQAIPSWVLRRTTSGVLDARASVFGPHNVWVFSLGLGAYAAHYNGHAWAKVRLPAVPADESATGPDDIYVLGNGDVFHWNGKNWAALFLPHIPLPGGASESDTDLSAAGPASVWLLRSISYRTTPAKSNPMHWNGKTWIAAASPTDIIGSIAPDGGGGLWADGIDLNPGGFWLLYHLTGGHWTNIGLPPGVEPHTSLGLTWIPGTRSLWATGRWFDSKGSWYAAILKYGR